MKIDNGREEDLKRKERKVPEKHRHPKERKENNQLSESGDDQKERNKTEQLPEKKETRQRDQTAAPVASHHAKKGTS